METNKLDRNSQKDIINLAKKTRKMILYAISLFGLQGLVTMYIGGMLIEATGVILLMANFLIQKIEKFNEGFAYAYEAGLTVGVFFNLLVVFVILIMKANESATYRYIGVFMGFLYSWTSLESYLSLGNMEININDQNMRVVVLLVSMVFISLNFLSTVVVKNVLQSDTYIEFLKLVKKMSKPNKDLL